MTNNPEPAAPAERRELAISLPNEIGFAQRIYGNGTLPQLVLRGTDKQIGALLIKALAGLGGSAVLLDGLDVADLACAVYTVGEVSADGVLDDLDKYSDRQREVGQLCAERFLSTDES